jgi:Fe-S cluster biogenesis protein NfuA
VDHAHFNGRMQRIEELIAAIQEHANPVVRASAVEMVRVLLDVHRAGLAEMLEQISGQGEPGQAIVNGFVNDDLISRLLLLHGLHPVDLETRVRKALDRVRPLLQAHGAGAELAEATNEAVRLQVSQGGEEVHQVLEQAILDAAPDVLRVEFVDADAAAIGLFSLPLVRES